ncbi:hypothetical protein LOK49_LG06G00348 [Camellia lanceoleosa]|uniref:Uncharacterized protein n=1 Tax=Camellia lanceoleosa TaxID=1840588 RepID=A0ACC0HH25_9ERIC|nr:hypothetical protein LOK49_LG06G00348 [Camellia lanceoleosa]
MSLSLPLSHTTTCSHPSSLTNDFVAPIPPLYRLKSKVDTADSRTWTISFSPAISTLTLSPLCYHYRTMPPLAPSL